MDRLPGFNGVGSQRNAEYLAQLAVESFDGSQPLSERQNDALQRWHVWCRDHWRSGPINAQHFPEIQKIYSDIFFLGRIGEQSELQIRWEEFTPWMTGRAHCRKAHSIWTTGKGHGRGAILKQPATIVMNSNDTSFSDSIEDTLGVILHEMAHAYFMRMEVITARAHLLDIGDGYSGHGIAWQHLMKGIEKHMWHFVLQKASIGRDIGLMAEIKAIVDRPEFAEDLLINAEAQLRPLLADLVEFPESRALALCYQERLAKLVKPQDDEKAKI